MLDCQVQIDEIDAKILTSLLKDARTSFAEIARNCGVSTNSIVKRFYKLKKAGVISGTALRVNIKNFQNKIAASIDINVDSHESSNVIDWLYKLPNLVAAYKLIGKYDIHASAITESLFDVHKIRDQLKMQKGVIRVGISASINEMICFPDNLVIEHMGVEKSGSN
jgi:Lrp/AsnC family transcriptional regulator for asnA, asnC and gidA